MKNMCLLIVTVMLMALAGCGDDGVSTGNGQPTVTFPHRVGTIWTYDYEKTEINGIDTTVVSDSVDVVVVGDTLLATGDSATIWVFRYGHQAVPDTHIVAMAVDTIKLEWDIESLFGTMVSILWPIDTSLTWVSGDSLTDTTTVSGPVNVSVRGHSYPNTFWIERRWAGLEESEQTDVWLVPNVGIVWYRFEFEQSMAQPSKRIQRWELLSYDMP